MAAREEERTIPRRFAPIGVSRSVTNRIGLRLNDAAAQDAVRRHPHDELADQISGELDRIDGKLGPREHHVSVRVESGHALL
jgi:hypothetical protein